MFGWGGIPQPEVRGVKISILRNEGQGIIKRSISPNEGQGIIKRSIRRNEGQGIIKRYNIPE